MPGKQILVLNSGSSSIKYSLFDMQQETVLASGVVERIAEENGVHRYRLFTGPEAGQEHTLSGEIPGHQDGLLAIRDVLLQSAAVRSSADLFAIGHRVVHGGEFFREPCRIDADVIMHIREMIPLAPLHNPANLMGIELSMQNSPDVPQVAVFDTAFHQTIPAHAYHYALPYALYSEDRVRRYGFHGTSHHFVARQAALFLGRPLQALNLITLHLGNGASVAAIRQGDCVDTSMGMTPLEGLIMGTRCGDIDPAIPFYLKREKGLSSEEVESLLNRESGLKGICGSNDMREVHQLAERGEQRALLALDMYCYRIKKYIGAYYAVLGHVDAIVFTGGIGENDAWVREHCCEQLAKLGIAIDSQRNRQAAAGVSDISQDDAVVQVLVIPTDEELEIALQTEECIRDG